MDMHSGLVLSRSDGRPMYLQIQEQIERKIALGDWPPGTELPSIRQLAVDLAVSVITVKRAYLELERTGVIYTQHGKGSTVADRPRNNATGPRLWEQALQKHLDEAVRLGELLDLSTKELETRLRESARRFKEES